jgi:phytoene desaturase
VTALLTRGFRRVVIVGAGLGGLSAACHLSGAGHRVTVLEQASGPGGRMARHTREGFTFDTGPTALTMPNLLEATFEAAGTPMSDLLTLRPLDPAYRAIFADGSTIRVHHGQEAMAAEIREQCGAAEEAGFGRFCRWLAQLYQVEMPAFIDRNYDEVRDLARPLGPALRLVRLGALRTWEQTVRSYFSDDRLVRMFSLPAMYAGLTPQKALALFAVTTYMDTIRGVYVPDGGIGAVPVALAKAAEKAGASLRYDTKAQKVLRNSAGRVRGVRLTDGTDLPADAVVVNTDMAVAYRSLLPDLSTPSSLRRVRYSPSAFVWRAGVRGSPPAEAAHHNIHFGTQWQESFRTLLKRRRRLPDPTVLVSVPSRNESGLAPADSSLLHVVEPVPNLTGRVNWTTERHRARDRLVRLVDEWGYPTDVVVEDQMDPTDWAQQGMAMGTPFSIAHTLFQSGPFRPPNVDRRMPGLVFVGSSTVPGVGVPMVLISGRLAAQRVEEL